MIVIFLYNTRWGPSQDAPFNIIIFYVLKTISYT